MISGVVELGRANDARLLRLQAALTLDRGFQLVIVEAEPGPIRREVVRRIQTWARHESLGPIALITLDPEATLAAQLASSGAAIVTGLEPPSPTEASPRDWLGELNLSRDLLPELVPGPLLLVVSQVVHAALFERAPDLYSWRRHTARFTVVVPELALPLCSPGDPYWLDGRERLESIRARVGAGSLGRALLLLNLAGVLLQLGDEPGASRVLDEISAPSDSQLVPEDADHLVEHVLLARAECALMRGELVTASSLLGDVERARVGALQDGLVLLRGKLHAAAGAWDEAEVDLARVLSDFTHLISAALMRARARECLAQVALARGDLARGRAEIAELLRTAGPWANEWGLGMMLRLASAAGDVYPDEPLPLLEASLVPAMSGSRRERRETMIAIRFARARRAWLLERGELVREELAAAKALVHPDDPDETHGFVHLYEAAALLVTGGSSDHEAARHLARACELLRRKVPKQAAITGRLLGELQAGRGQHELAVAAYRAAAEDARRAGAPEVAADAELGELGAAVEGGLGGVDTPDRLRDLAERLRSTEHTLREGIARAHLGRALLRRGLREPAVAEIERARACFEATADAERAREIARLLEGSP